MQEMCPPNEDMLLIYIKILILLCSLIPFTGTIKLYVTWMLDAANMVVGLIEALQKAEDRL